MSRGGVVVRRVRWSARPRRFPTWDKSLPPTRGHGHAARPPPARGIVHLHSPYSHDACDGMPRDASGAPNEPCLAATCAPRCARRTSTTPRSPITTTRWPTRSSRRCSACAAATAGDERAGDQIASRITCDDGHTVLVTVGGENDLMPIMLDHHVARRRSQRAPRDLQRRRRGGGRRRCATPAGSCGSRTPSSTPSRSCATVAPDGIEVYNLHANIDPKIRATYLGLDRGGRDRRGGRVRRHQPGPSRARPRAARRSSRRTCPRSTRWNELLADGRHDRRRPPAATRTRTRCP